MTRMFRWGMLLTLLMLVGRGWAADVDALVAALAGDNDVARSAARQMLARESAAVVPKILPLIKDTKPAVWKAAFNVLADLGNEVSVPGRESERAAMTKALMTLIAADQPAEIKLRGSGCCRSSRLPMPISDRWPACSTMPNCVRKPASPWRKWPHPRPARCCAPNWPRRTRSSPARF